MLLIQGHLMTHFNGPKIWVNWDLVWKYIHNSSGGNKLQNIFYSAVCLMRYHVFCIYMFSWMIDYGWLFFW